MLDCLKERLLAHELGAEFIKGFQEEVEAIRRERRSGAAQRARKLDEVERKVSGMLRAIEDGLYEPAMKARLIDLQAERAALQPDLDDNGDANVAILSHPNLPELYRPRSPSSKRFWTDRTGRKRWTSSAR